jgi:hypothetical protein
VNDRPGPMGEPPLFPLGLRSEEGQRAADRIYRNPLPDRRPGLTSYTLVALDLSYTCTGVAWLTSTGYVGLTSLQTDPIPDPRRWGTSLALRRRSIVRRLRPYIEGSSLLDLAALHGSVEDLADELARPVASVNVGRVKVYGANTGRADKQQMTDAARREMGGLVMVTNPDEADALWVLAIMCHVYGRPLVRNSRRRAEVVGQVKPGWPVADVAMPEQIRTRRLPSAGR